MRRVLFLCLFLLLSKTAGECATTLFPPLQPLVENNNSLRDYNNNLTNLPDAQQQQMPQPKNVSTYKNISQIEQTIFGRSFENQNISSRLSRIEKSLFSTTYPSSSDSQRIDNIISNYNQINKYPNISQKDLSRLEARVLNQTFPQNSATRRIERLEEQMFGAAQSGDISARLETLKLAAKKTTTNQADYSIDDPFQQTGFKGIGGNWGNILSSRRLGGMMTGFTPPISPFSTNNFAYNGLNGFNNGFNNYNRYNRYPARYGTYPGNRSGTGYQEGYGNSSGSTGVGVTILD